MIRAEIIMKEKGRFMTPLQLKDSLLGFLPNLTERRTIVQQRSVRTLENMLNYASWFESNQDKVQAAFDRREHIVRLIYTDDYLKNGQELKIDHTDFNVTQRNYNLKTKEPLSSPKDDYWINNNSVTKTEYEFGKYLVAHFETLKNVVNYAKQENIAIQQTLADKEARLQEVNNRRIAEEAVKKMKLQQQAFDEKSKRYKEFGNENSPILEAKWQSTLDFSAFEDEGYEITGDLTRAIYILPEGALWSGYYSEAPEVRAIEHREIEGFVRDEILDRDSNGFWEETLKEVVMVIPEKETLLLLNRAIYDDGQKERISDYQELGWNITYEDPKLTVSDGHEIIQDELDEERVMDNNLKIVNSISSSALENKVEKIDFNFASITEEIFNERTEQLVMKWEDFKTPTGETDANEAFGALVQDVWDAKYRYATLDEKDKLEKWLDGYYDHFYDGGRKEYEQALKTGSSEGYIINYNEKAIDQFVSLYDQHLLELEKLPPSVNAPRIVEKVGSLGESVSKDTYETTYKNNSKNTEAAEKSSASMDLVQEAIQKIKKYSQDPKEMKEYLDFMSKFPQFSPRNTALLHEQWQGANIVATYDQWRGKATDPAKNMPQVLEVKPTDIEQIKGSVTDLKTDVTKKKDMGQLSVRLGEKSQIKLLRPVTQEYILKERDGKIQPHFKKYWSKEEKEKVKSGDIPVRKKTSYVPQAYFEISQTNIKSESLPKMMPNRHINFDLNPKLAIAMQKGLEIYAQDEAKVPIEMTESGDNRLGNAKGAYYPSSEKIRLNHLNTPSENVPVLIHELTHATLHKEGNTNKMSSEYANQELEAELTAYVVSKRYGLDTEKESLSYIAKWTNNAKSLSDKELSASLSHVQKTADKMTAYIDTQLDPALKLSQQQAQIKAHAIERTQATPSFKPLGLTR